MVVVVVVVVVAAVVVVCRYTCSAPYIFRDALLALNSAAFGHLRVLRADRVRCRGLTPHFLLLCIAACKWL